jgi:2-polyprenyl-3-methyl-5-hydroxy-6-metoxy-1,4-benzoquinol methylase
METIFYLKYESKFNKFKNLNSENSYDPIPSSFYALKKIEKFILKNEIKTICDLGCGYGKIVYYLGVIKKLKVDGVELNESIYQDILFLKNKNIKIFNENILQFNLDKKNYDLLIINDPLKKVHDFENLIKKIKNTSHKIFIAMININSEKVKIATDNLKIIDYNFFSNNRNIIFLKKE